MFHQLVETEMNTKDRFSQSFIFHPFFLFFFWYKKGKRYKQVTPLYDQYIETQTTFLL